MKLDLTDKIFIMGIELMLGVKYTKVHKFDRFHKADGQPPNVSLRISIERNPLLKI